MNQQHAVTHYRGCLGQPADATVFLKVLINWWKKNGPFNEFKRQCKAKQANLDFASYTKKLTAANCYCPQAQDMNLSNWSVKANPSIMATSKFNGSVVAFPPSLIPFSTSASTSIIYVGNRIITIQMILLLTCNTCMKIKLRWSKCCNMQRKYVSC